MPQPSCRSVRHDEYVRHLITSTARQGGDWKSLAAELQVNVKTAYRWISLAKRGELESRRRAWGGKRFEKVASEHIDFLHAALAENASLTLAQLAALLDKKFSVKVTPQTVKNRLDRLNYLYAQARAAQP